MIREFRVPLAFSVFAALTIFISTRPRVESAMASTNPVSAIRLTRHSCSTGVCPDYVLTLRSDGCDSLIGLANFALIGPYSGFQSHFADAVEAINTHRFFQLKSDYPVSSLVLDAPVSSLEVFRVHAASKKVTITGSRGVPPSVVELFHIVDGIGFTDYWVNDATKAPVSTASAGGSLAITNFKPCGEEPP
jgi:hypothetical protein